eukprot:scaffold19929_cov67-Phaeocystis_antarctica.AAC.3
MRRVASRRSPRAGRHQHGALRLALLPTEVALSTSVPTEEPEGGASSQPAKSNSSSTLAGERALQRLSTRLCSPVRLQA